MAQRLSSEERARVEAMTAAGVGVKETAWRLGRHCSTVYRELARNCGSGGYDAQAAQTAADRRARRPKTPVLAADPVLAAAALSRLRDRRSPHAASAELRAEGLSVSAETIYRACYDPTGRRGLPEGCWRLLPRRCRRRKPRGRHTRKPSPLGDFRPIADRTAAAAGRSEAGHWEGDLIIGKNNRSAAVTLTERVSRQTLVAALPHGYDARHTADAVTAALARQPRHMVKTLTWDQGREMARWQHVENATGAKVYFCEPRSPRQRPTNEQTNCEYRGCALERAPDWSRRRCRDPQTIGLLRRWLPKGTDLNTRPSAPRHHRGPPQHHAPQAPRLALSPQRLHCPLSQPPVELALPPTIRRRRRARRPSRRSTPQRCRE